MNTVRAHTDRTPWLDGWRGIAILLVLCDHFTPLSTGRLGVDVFFVLSGFLMSRILFEQRTPLTLFYRRRIARTMPVFYLYLLTIALFAWMLSPSVDWSSIAATAVFLRSYIGEHIWEDPLAIGHIWSLAVEEHAYLILSLVALFTASHSERRARWILTCLSFVPVLFYAYYRKFPIEHGTIHQLRTECAIFPLIASAAVFLWVKDYKLKISSGSFVALFATTVAGAVLAEIGISQGGTLLRQMLLPLALAVVVNFLSCAPPWMRAAFSTRWLMWLGVCSYSVYLWNYPFFRLMEMGKWPFGTAGAVACSMAVAVASFYWFEQPMRGWLRRERKQKTEQIQRATAESR